MTPTRIALLFALTPVLASSIAPVPATAQDSAASGPPACSEVAGFARLDFWLGEWDVYAGDRRVGTNRVEKILDGCAVMEHWLSAVGGEGKSLFYYLPREEVWKQVWVTGRATGLGGVKEKTLVEELPGGALRFQGRIPLPEGSESFLDRTTLTPLPGGRVRQVIETSGDEGATWALRWDAVYVPAGAPAPTADSSSDPETEPSSEPEATQPGTSSQVD